MTASETESGYNLPLLRKVRDHIVAHPEQHDQNYWLRGDFASIADAQSAVGDKFHVYDTTVVVGTVGDLLTVKNARCDTVACLAGWAVMLTPSSSQVAPTTLIEEEAERLFGFTLKEAATMFSPSITHDQMVWILDLIVDQGFTVADAAAVPEDRT